MNSEFPEARLQRFDPCDALSGVDDSMSAPRVVAGAIVAPVLPEGGVVFLHYGRNVCAESSGSGDDRRNISRIGKSWINVKMHFEITDPLLTHLNRIFPEKKNPEIH